MLSYNQHRTWPLLLVAALFLASCGNKEQKVVDAGSASVARLTITKGDVKVVEGEMVRPASSGQLLKAGQIIRTGAESMAEIFVKDQGIVRLSENTEFGLNRVDANGVELDQKSGTSMVFLKRLKQDSEFTIHTPTSVAAVRGTSFMVDVKSEKESTFALYDGAIEVKNQRGQSVVLEGKGEVSVKAKGNLTEEAIRPLSKESLEQLKRMAVFQKTQITEYNSFIDDLKETEALKMTREEGDVSEQLEGMQSRPTSQVRTGQASSADENMIRRNTEKDPLKIQPQKTFQ